MSSTPITQELKDLIVGHIRDTNSLASCSLASWSFFHAARRYFFTELQVDQSNISTLLEMLNSPLCTLPHYVRHLVLRDPVKGYYDDPDRAWIDRLTPYLERFPEISSLTINVEYPIRFFDTLHYPKDFFVRLPKVTTLSLHNVFFYNGCEPYHLMFNLLPSLTRINLQDVGCKHYWFMGQSELRPPQLHTLVVHSSLSVIDKLFSPPLHTLELINISPDYMKEIGDLLYVVRETLQKLVFGFDHDSFTDHDLDENIELRHNEKLRILHLNSEGIMERLNESGEEGPEIIGGHLPLLLSDVGLESLQELHLDLRPNSDTVFPKPGQTSPVWADISRIITEKFAGLQKIVLTLPYADFEGIAALIRDDFANLFHGGVLQIEQGELSCGTSLEAGSGSDQEDEDTEDEDTEDVDADDGRAM